MPIKTAQEIEAEVQELVAGGKTPKAISLLIEHFKSSGDNARHRAILKLSAQYKTIEKKLNMSEMTKEQADVGFSKIMDATLDAFKVIPEGSDEEITHSDNDKFGKRIIQISALLILLFLIVGIIVAVVTQGVDPIVKSLQASLFVVGASMVAFGLLFLVKKYILV